MISLRTLARGLALGLVLALGGALAPAPALAATLPYTFGAAHTLTMTGRPFELRSEQIRLRTGEGIQATYRRDLVQSALYPAGGRRPVGLTQELWTDDGRACPRWTAPSSGTYVMYFWGTGSTVSSRVRINRFFYPGFPSAEGRFSDPFSCPAL